MGDLTYSVYYTPSKEIMLDEDINYICSDNKVHVRFRDFDKEEIIAGFEKKLAYLVTYLMNYSYMPKVIGQYENKTLMDTFSKTNEVASILTCVRLTSHNDNLKGIKLFKNFKKVGEIKDFGNTDPDCFPLNEVNGVKENGSLETFLSTLNINLTEYLFNDAYMIILHKDKMKELNKKFKNKQIRKENRITKSDFDLVELW